MPTAVGVMLTEQLALLVVGIPSVHVPLGVKVTVPVGAVAPVVDVSDTVAVQLVGVLSRTLAGAHDTVVVVDLIVDVTVNAALVLPVWTLSPAKLPVMP